MEIVLRQRLSKPSSKNGSVLDFVLLSVRFLIEGREERNVAGVEGENDAFRSWNASCDATWMDPTASVAVVVVVVSIRETFRSLRTETRRIRIKRP